MLRCPAILILDVYQLLDIGKHSGVPVACNTHIRRISTKEMRFNIMLFKRPAILILDVYQPKYTSPMIMAKHRGNTHIRCMLIAPKNTTIHITSTTIPILDVC